MLHRESDACCQTQVILATTQIGYQSEWLPVRTATSHIGYQPDWLATYDLATNQDGHRQMQGLKHIMLFVLRSETA